MHPVSEFANLLVSRAVDVALGPAVPHVDEPLLQHPFLAYEVLVVASPEHPVATGHVALDQLADQTWHLGPGAVLPGGEASEVLRRLALPEKRQRIFQSDAAALAETRRGVGLGIAVGFTVRDDLRSGRLVRIDAPHLASRGAWATWALLRQPAAVGERGADPVRRDSASDPGDGPRRGSGSRQVPAGRARHLVELAATASKTSGRAATECAGRNASQKGSAAAIDPTSGSKPGTPRRVG